MGGFDIWDGVLLTVLSYVALVSLVRLMRKHRQELTASLKSQFQAEQLRKRAEEKRRRQQEREQGGDRAA